MEIQTISTGSKGNCYILSHEHRRIIFDAGVTMTEIKKAIDYDVNSVDMAFITHAHRDHARSLKKLLDMGVLVVMPPSLYEQYKDKYINAVKLEPENIYNLNGVLVTALPVPHDTTECYGYIITWKGQKIAYLTDLEYCPFDLSQLEITTAIVECNYDEEYVNLDIPQIKHKLLGHMGVKTCSQFISTLNKETLKNVFLCHMGEGMCDYDTLIQKIKKVTQANVYVCVPKLLAEI